MRQPAASAAYIHRVTYGIFVARMLRTHGLSDLEARVRDASLNLRTLGRGQEDCQLEIQEAMADRQARDLELDVIAQDARRALEGRSRNAAKSAPYTLIFPEKIRFYVQAPVAEEVSRYTLLVERLKNNLAEDDGVRLEYVPRLEAAIPAYEAAEKALETARNTERQAGDRLSTAEAAWGELIDKTFGELTAKYGSEMAERFFPRV